MTKNLILVRHAAAVKHDQDLKDFDRPLSDTGLHDALLMGKKLSAMQLKMDKWISSPALRTKMTVEFFAEQMGMSIDEIIYNRNIYEASVRILMQVISEFNNNWNTIALVGHNPDLSYLAEILTKDEIGVLPTCGVIAIELETDSWAHVSEVSGKMIFYEYPQ